MPAATARTANAAEYEVAAAMAPAANAPSPDRVSNVIMDVPAFLDRVSDSDLTFFDPGQVAGWLAVHGRGDQVGSYLRRLSGGLQSTGTVRADGPAVLAAARRLLAGEAETRHVIAADLVEMLNHAGCSRLLAEPLPDG